MDKYSRRIGISGMGFYFPKHYISLEELLQARGEHPGRATAGLGVQRMALSASNEDSVSMAANAVDSLEFSRDKIGKLIFATECGIDQAKDNASYICELCNLPKNCEAYDVKAACAASTYALWQVIDWILSGRGQGKQGLVVCSDMAMYECMSGAELTGGAGAVALLVEEDASIINFDLETGDFKRNVRDFWKPHGEECAVIPENGRPSVLSYLDALAPSIQNYFDNGGKRDFDYLVFHTPYPKMVSKAFDNLSKVVPEIEGRFESMTSDSLKGPAFVGNIYNGSLYLALASLLEINKTTVKGKRIGLYSFGSGSSSKFFSGVVNPNFNNSFYLFKQFENMEKIPPEFYERIRRGEEELKESKGFLLNGIDEQGYRHYSKF